MFQRFIFPVLHRLVPLNRRSCYLRCQTMIVLILSCQLHLTNQSWADRVNAVPGIVGTVPPTSLSFWLNCSGTQTHGLRQEVSWDMAGQQPKVRQTRSIIKILLLAQLQRWHTSPRGSKYPMLEDSGSKNHTLNGFWDQGPLNIGDLDPLGQSKRFRTCSVDESMKATLG